MNRALTIIRDGMEYIEKHIKEKVALEDIATHVGVSKYHLDRIFKSLTGETIINYATSRKLSLSIWELLNTKMKIIDIAFEYGFTYEQSYIRAFRKAYGQTPAKIRARDESILVKEMIDIHDIMEVDHAITYRPFFVVKPAFNLIGIKHEVPSEADYTLPNQVGRDFFYNHQQRVKNAKNRNVYYGYVEWTASKDRSIYVPSVQAKKIDEIPEGMIALSIPTQKYAVFRFVGFFRPDQVNVEHFYHLIEFMFFKWITPSGYDLAGSYRFEYIDNALAKDDYCEVDLYLPIKDKSREPGY